MAPRLVVLGGSSPFTAALVDAIAAAPGLPPHSLVLHGRDPRGLDLVRAYAAHHLRPLGWTAGAETRLDAALDGAGVVLHQVRYGGMAARARDEAFCAAHGCPADETLGPAALLSALRALPGLEAVSREIGSAAPDAWVLNLTNPLSAVTALMSEAGIRRCIGVCELPEATLAGAAAVLDVAPAELEWRYAGLNHRGFLYDLRHRGGDVLDALVARLGSRTLGGIPAAVIARLRAVPLKYFSLVMEGGAPPRPRARFLSTLRERIQGELARSVTVSPPPSLRERRMDWYAGAVVPMLAAIHADTPTLRVGSIRAPDGLAREEKTWVSREGITPVPAPRPPPEAGEWIACFERHERALLDALGDPSPGGIHRALAADPVLPAGAAERVSAALWDAYRAESGAETAVAVGGG
ncbi:MAG TPA: hypothetical protein VFS20_27285 [Longimicrobium sp.]|nr:hypothetical protein [Longimicrobium sp.]